VRYKRRYGLHERRPQRRGTLISRFPRREQLEALVAHYRHLQNEHHRAPVDSAPRRRIEEKLLDVRSRFERVLDEWVPEEELRRAWWEHLHNRAPEPDGPSEIRPLVFAGRSEVTGSIVEIRSKQADVLEVMVDGAPFERADADEDFSVTVPPVKFRLNGNEFVELFSASPEALRALAEFLDMEGATPPWDYAPELLADGLIDTNFALTPRGRRALAVTAAER
jgi:hypothetical protein